MQRDIANHYGVEFTQLAKCHWEECFTTITNLVPSWLTSVKTNKLKDADVLTCDLIRNIATHRIAEFLASNVPGALFHVEALNTALEELGLLRRRITVPPGERPQQIAVETAKAQPLMPQDAEALAEVFNYFRCNPAIWHFGGPNAEDAFQDFFVRLAQNPEELEEFLRRGKPLGYIVNWVRWKFLQELRRDKRFSAAANAEFAVAEVAKQFGFLDFKKFLDEVPTPKGLSNKQRACFVLQEIEGFMSSEIGHILAMPSSTVRVHVWTSRGKCSEWLLSGAPAVSL